MLERKALDRWGAGDPGGFLDVYGPGITYFDPVAAARIDGWDAMRDYYAPWIGKIYVKRYDIVNPHVVVGGDMAVLTYNLTNFVDNKDGVEVVLNRWNSSVVYQRIGADWKIIHSHWSYIQPTLAAAGGAVDVDMMA